MAALEITIPSIPSIQDPEYQALFGQYNADVMTPSLMPARTTRKLSVGISGCRYSAFIYFCIALLWPKYELRKVEQLGEHRDIHNFSTELKQLLDIKKPRLPSPLREILVDNMDIDGEEMNIDSLDAKLNEYPIAFLGISRLYEETRMLGHYFIICKRDRGYSIISSYGSEFVAIRQYETFVSKEDLNEFIYALEETIHKKSVDIISKFFKTHFLNTEYGIPNSIDSEEGLKNRPETSHEKSSVDKEIDVVLSNREAKKYKLVYFDMKTMIERMRESMHKGGTRRRRRKRRTRKHK